MNHMALHLRRNTEDRISRKPDLVCSELGDQTHHPVVTQTERHDGIPHQRVKVGEALLVDSLGLWLGVESSLFPVCLQG